MKTIKELYSEIMASEELKKEFEEAVKETDTFKSFLKKYDCEASIEDVEAFLQEISQNMSEDNLDAVAGGAAGTSDYLQMGGFAAMFGGSIAAVVSQETRKKSCATATNILDTGGRIAIQARNMF